MRPGATTHSDRPHVLQDALSATSRAKTAATMCPPVTPFLGASNVTRVRYDDRIRPNAGFGRYFEPAPRGTWFGGVDIRFGD